MRLFQAPVDTCLDSSLLASLSVHGLHFTVYAPSIFNNHWTENAYAIVSEASFDEKNAQCFLNDFQTYDVMYIWFGTPHMGCLLNGALGPTETFGHALHIFQGS